jgi:hypothetical protein
MARVPLGLRVEIEIKKGLQKAAAEEQRTLSQLAEIILRDWLAARRPAVKKRRT